jgi:4-amino-4-deoxy-L-arabinose transferase-like glycosyltransferase
VGRLFSGFSGGWLRSRGLFLCVAGTALLYLFGLGKPPLWEPDEGRYAEVAREMLLSHDYITPHNNFVPYLEKPPLVYWATAGFMKIFGQNEFGVRLQAALAAIGQVAITGVLAETMFGSTGTLAAICLALSPLFFSFARFATPDPVLAFFMTAAMACFYAASQAPSFRSSSGIAWMIAAAAMLGLGTLAKGPVALVLGGTIALLWLITERRTHEVLRIPWIGCAVVYLAITVPWFVMVARVNPGFVNFFFVHEHFQRYLADTEHGWGPWFFFPIIIGGTWPWLYFALLASPAGFQRIKRVRGSKTRSREPGDQSHAPADVITASASRDIELEVAPVRAGDQLLANELAAQRHRAAVRFLLIWFGVIFLFFSIPRSKLGEYILPALPPIAILAGEALVRLTRMPAAQRNRLMAIFTAVNAAIALSIVVAVLLGAAGRLAAVLMNNILIVAAALLLGAVAAFSWNRGRAAVHRILAPLGLAVVIAMAAAINAREKVASLVSYRSLAASVTPLARQGCKLASYRHFEQSLPFYTSMRETLVNYRGELEPFGPLHDKQGIVFATDAQLRKSWAGNRCVVLIANRSDVAALAALLSPAPTVIGCEGKKLALYNRPSAKGFENAQGCL